MIKRQNHGHAVMNALHVGVGGTGDDGAAAVMPKPCKGEELLIGQLKIIGLLTFPLVESVCGNQAAAGGEQIFEHRALSEGFCAGIDDGCTGSGILKTPHALFGMGGFTLPDNGNLLSRGNIIAPVEQGW